MPTLRELFRIAEAREKGLEGTAEGGYPQAPPNLCGERMTFPVEKDRCNQKWSIEYEGELIPLAEASKKSNVPYSTIHKRLKRWKWDDKAALQPYEEKLFEYRGQKQTLFKWCKDLNLKHITVYKRIHYYNWSIKDALEVPVSRTKTGKAKVFVALGKAQTLREWSKDTGIPLRTLKARIYQLKWNDLDRVFSTPYKRYKNAPN